ncbi:TetR/AcrR family transcriptional regulator [Microbispora sp. NPDC049125]|uniref:TetR/AcrR family transcriptional regulator n=1 Tax=Microbispora sp. NPDC049125 TaxID=3154929 RepID=UPI0034663614
MGNREDLLAGAKRCLLEKGYARTTARDIAVASGVSLAAIGYHYGSKEALLTAALVEAIEEWGADLGRLLAQESASGGAGSFVATWTKVVESLGASRPLWAVQFETIAHLERTPEMRVAFPESTREARLGLAHLFGHAVGGGADGGADGDSADEGGTDGADVDTALAVGAFYQALLVGTAALWLSDPASVPSGEDLVVALRAVAARTEPAAPAPDGTP